MTATVSNSSDPASRMLEWLAREPRDDCLEDLEALSDFLVPLIEVADGSESIVVCADLVAVRALDISERFKPRLLAGRLPLEKSMHAAAERLTEALRGVARVFEGVIAASPPVALKAHAAHQALRMLGEGFMIAYMSGIEPPAALWREANRVLRKRIDSADADEGESQWQAALAEYKRVLAIAAVQPESLTARELHWLFEYLDVVAGAVELTGSPLKPDGPVFWIDLARDQPPVALVRMAPRGGDLLMYFRALGVSKRAGEQIEWLETRLAEAEIVGIERDVELLEPEVSGLPLGLTPEEVLSMLRRLRERWTTPPAREHLRRENHYRVQVCKGLKQIWKLFRTGLSEAAISEWRVYNESPGGYAIMNIGKLDDDVSAGMALALRRGIGEPWSICVVRWIRGDNPLELELGLQVVGERCRPVMVGFRGGEMRAPSPALLFPAEFGRGNAAIVAPAGTYTSRRFVMVHETDHLYVAQGRVLSLDMQTAAIEMFQYEIDPYPI